MSKIITNPAKLAEFIRDGLVEQEHFGYVVRCDETGIVETIGEDRNYPFYLRSCAKPLQASLLIDFGLDKEFDLSPEEIAICCASHAGEDFHTEIVTNLLKKFGISQSKLKCGKHEPVSKTAFHKLIKNGQEATEFHNNCSGKHAMMLGLCKLKGWDLESYDLLEHPLQQAIKNKIYSLCKVKKDYPVTRDGCGVPIFSMPLANMVKGYLNLFCDEKYEKIKNAFLNQPYAIGGENRTDTKIIQQAKIIAKVGAGGLCIVLNPDIKEGFIVKICDSNMQAREIVCVDLIKNLHWGNLEVDREIKTINGCKVGEIHTLV